MTRIAATIRRASKVHPIATLQTEYSLWSRDPEGEILKTCRELGLGFVAYSPLGRGFLTGRFKTPEDIPQDDWRRRHPRFRVARRRPRARSVALCDIGARHPREHAGRRGARRDRGKTLPVPAGRARGPDEFQRALQA